MSQISLFKRRLIMPLVGILMFCHTVSAQHLRTITLSKEDTTRNKLVVVSPPTGVKTSAYMFLIPGSFEQPQNVLLQSQLPEMASAKGIMVFIPVFETGITSFGADNSTQNSLTKLLEYCINKYGLQGKDFYLGGFSMGGTCAVKYAEMATRNDYQVKPKAVFAIDPPLDFTRFYKAARRSLRLTRGMPENPETLYMIDRIEKKMGGTPESVPQHYFDMSPYSYDDTTQTAVKLLVNTPISIYAEPDIEWWLQARAFDYSRINAPDGAALINELHLLGNKQARFISTANKGYRYPGKNKHPHSWSVLNGEELLSWFDSL